jgi:hypothetical protein
VPRRRQNFHSPIFHSPKPLDQIHPLPGCNLTKATVSWSSPGALHAVLIAVERGGGLVEEGRREFLPSEIGNSFASGSTPSGPMVKWMAQAYPTHQFGLPPTLHAFLIAVESGCRGVEEGFFSARNQEWFCFWLHAQWSYGQMDGTGASSASTWSTTNPPRFSNCS